MLFYHMAKGRRNLGIHPPVAMNTTVMAFCELISFVVS